MILCNKALKLLRLCMFLTIKTRNKSAVLFSYKNKVFLQKYSNRRNVSCNKNRFSKIKSVLK